MPALLCGLVALALSGGLVGGCTPRAKSPREAWERFVHAVASKDGKALYAALDLETRWSWMSVRRAQREAYDILLSNLPPGPVRDRQLRRFETGALADDEAALFAASMTPARWDDLAGDVPASASALAPAAAGPNEATVKTGSGRTFLLKRGQDGGWGFAGFAAEAEDLKQRAGTDLDLVRTNTADFERAATRAGR